MKSGLKHCREVLDLIKPVSIPMTIRTLDDVRASLSELPCYTLLPDDFFVSMMECVSLHQGIQREGDWVQVGVWRGGGALFLRALMEDLGCKGRLHLFDTFDAVPVDQLRHCKDVAFVEGLSLKNNQKIAPASPVQVKELFSKQKLSGRVEIYPGDISNMSRKLVPKSISFLHLDVDFYEPTYQALSLFYDNVVPGGTIIIDDYYMDLLGCQDAVNDFMSVNGICRSVLGRFSSYSAKLTKP